MRVDGAVLQVDVLHAFLAHQQKVLGRPVAIAAVMMARREDRLQIVLDLHLACFWIQSEKIIRSLPAVRVDPDQAPDRVDVQIGRIAPVRAGLAPQLFARVRRQTNERHGHAVDQFLLGNVGLCEKDAAIVIHDAPQVRKHLARGNPNRLIVALRQYRRGTWHGPGLLPIVQTECQDVLRCDAIDMVAPCGDHEPPLFQNVGFATFAKVIQRWKRACFPEWFPAGCIDGQNLKRGSAGCFRLWLRSN